MFAQLFRHASQVVLVDAIGVVIVEEFKDLSKSFSCALISQRRRDGCDKHFKVDLFISRLDLQVSNHVRDCRVFVFKAQRLDCCLQLFDVDGASTVSVEKVESFSNFLDLFFREA